MKIGSKEIRNFGVPFIIAEAAISHQGEIEVAKNMVYHAKAAGCDAIKFQMHILDDEMLLEVPTSDNFEKPLYETLKDTNLTIDEHRVLKDLCESLEIEYLCTPFSRKASDILYDMGIKAFKIGSGEMTNLPLIKHIAGKGLPVILSTGMCTMEEVEVSVREILSLNKNLILTHCVSAYPCPYEIVNLGLISEYQKRFSVPVGLSDHTIGIYSSLGSVSFGAALVEKHFTLDKLQSGPDHAVSLEPDELMELVKGCKAVQQCLGNQKIIHELEKPIVAWARESVVAIKEILPGDVLTLDNIWVKRPSPNSEELPASEFERVLGRKANKRIKSDTKIQKRDIE